MLKNASGKPDPLQIQVTVDGTTSFAAHSLHGTMSCLSLTLFILSTSNDSHKPLAEVEIIVFRLMFPVWKWKLVLSIFASSCLYWAKSISF